MTIPTHLVHYYIPDRAPFLNLSDLSEEELKPVVEGLRQRTLDGKTKREFHDYYFPQRKEAEQNLRKVYIEKGGKPERKAPHYFYLGRSKIVEFMFNGNFKTIELPIELVEKEVVFSIGDSIHTFSKPYKEGIKWENKWYQGKLYNFEETVEIIKQLELDLEVDLNNRESYKKHQIFAIEGLIWSDKILNDALKRAT